jgi:hypothetical protein
MPITFTVNHAKGLVVVVATGTVTREAVVRYFDTQRMLDGLSYRRLVECRNLASQLTGADWIEVAAWLRQMPPGRLGPAAVIVDNERTLELVELISILVRDVCDLRPFGDRRSAEEWLSDRLVHGAGDRQGT